MALTVAAPSVDTVGPRGRRQLDSVFPSVAAALGVEGFANTLDLPMGDRWVVMVVDGLGLQLLQQHADAGPFLWALSGIAVSTNPRSAGTPSAIWAGVFRSTNR